MTILNNKTNNTKVRDIKDIYCIYETQGKTDTELKDDLILVGNVNYNTILKSLKVSTSATAAGLTVDVVLLNRNKEEFTYTKSDGTEANLTSLKAGLSLATALNDQEQLTSAFKFQTLEEYIINETAQPNYREQVFVALKIKTPPTAKIKGVKILTEINFVENV